MNEDVELIVWLTPVFLVVMILGSLGLMWTRYMVTGAVKIIEMIGGLI